MANWRLRLGEDAIEVIDTEVGGAGEKLIGIDPATRKIDSLNIKDEILAWSGVNTDFKIISGLFARQKSAPDLNLRHSEGMVKLGGTKKYVPTKDTDGLAVSTASPGKEKLGVLQVDAGGNVSIRYGAEVNYGEGNAQYPDPAAGNIRVANLFMPGMPITEYITAVMNVDIFNEYGDRLC